ncbi:glycosyltransferase family 2 protein [Anaerobacillus sp. HL2]|nr:glycosyltransferase family 2 protein [Anaerobacillus sp. HL2]
MIITTPAYNRGYILGALLFNSLCKQILNAFEWIVIDDGSNDNTRDIVKQWANQKYKL